MDRKKLESQSAHSKTRVDPVLLVSVFVLATALVALSIMAGLYFHNTQDNCGKGENRFTEHFVATNNQGEQEIDVDPDNEVEKFVQKDDSGHITGVVVLDYRKRLMAMYLSSQDQCYIYGGIDQEMMSLNDSLKCLKQIRTERPAGPVLNYEIADKQPISDRSVLPVEMGTHCASLPLYWIQRTKGGSIKHIRQVRAAATSSASICCICCCMPCPCRCPLDDILDIGRSTRERRGVE